MSKSGIFWKTQDGREIDLVDIESDHLINCIKMVLRNFVASAIKKEEADAILGHGVDERTTIQLLNYTKHGARGVKRIKGFTDLCEEARRRDIILRQHFHDAILEGAEKSYVLQVASRLRESAMRPEDV